jgi:hypothetical protein
MSVSSQEGRFIWIKNEKNYARMPTHIELNMMEG